MDRCHCGCLSLRQSDHCCCCGCEELEEWCDHKCQHDSNGSRCHSWLDSDDLSGCGE